MTNLSINPEAAIMVILFLISVISFIFVYNKAIKSRVDREDLSDLRKYVDQQDRSVHHRVDEVNARLDKVQANIESKLDLIYSILMKK